ncbi:hypothetical protein NDU88_002867 [Pleurodeles waltl]|uniref:Uncharacterized protein n=1 Tax=Pleurodeles waltl TaxID=8319 RepID=A0AAV7TN23_PLEWA|nr:hypothetical protein NDU88_002867 [Pleurodeles waltl]
MPRASLILTRRQHRVDSHLQGCHLQDDDLTQYPGFTKLLLEVSQQFDESGVSLQLKKELELVRRRFNQVVMVKGKTAPSQHGGRAANPSLQRPARARRFIRGPAPARSRAAPVSPASLQRCLSGRSPPRAHGPPLATSVPLPQQGDPSKVPRCTQAVRSSSAAARSFTRGRGFRRGEWPLASSPVNQAHLSPPWPPGPQRGPGSIQGRPPAQRLDLNVGWPGLARFTAIYSIGLSGATESDVRHHRNLGHAPQYIVDLLN